MIERRAKKHKGRQRLTKDYISELCRDPSCTHELISSSFHHLARGSFVHGKAVRARREEEAVESAAPRIYHTISFPSGSEASAGAGAGRACALTPAWVGGASARSAMAQRDSRTQRANASALQRINERVYPDRQKRLLMSSARVRARSRARRIDG
eukprot:5247214-Pleurochrysis_carterae.AAC.1